MNPHNRQSSVTAQDVAELAGVSRAVVSRALSNNGSISPQTKQKVLAAAAQLGYQVNFLAQGLNRKRSMLIGVVVARITDPFRSSLLDGLIREIQHRGFQALVTEVGDTADMAETLRRFTQFRVSGVVVTSGQPPQAIINECVQHHIPVVGINRPATPPFVDAVCSDNHAGATLAAAQLHRAGCRRFGWLNYAYSTWAGRQRGEAFLQALKMSDISSPVIPLIAQEDGWQGGRLAAQHYANAMENIDGVFCANAQLACGFLEGMRQQGKNAPEDFHLIGFDNTPQTAYDSYQLTTLHQDVSMLATRAMDCLTARAQNPLREACTEWVGVELIHRRTSPLIM